MGARAVISHLPVDYGAWRSLALIRFGGMEQPGWAYEVVQRHMRAAQFVPRPGFSVLELGPGDSLFTALIARAQGASAIHLVDVGAFANPDLSLYRSMNELLAEKGIPALDWQDFGSIDDLLAACSARYDTRGLESLREIPDRSVDFLFSNAVLQHVPRDQFADTLRELRRILRDGGCCSHSVDLRDMMGQALNHLRFSETIWESNWVRRCGFYSNRLRYSEMIEEFRSAGFAVEPNEINRWESLPTPRSRLAPGYRDLSEDELRIATFNVVLRPL